MNHLHRIPCNYTSTASAEGSAFERLKLGYRAGERQPPNCTRKGRMFWQMLHQRKVADPTLSERKSDREILEDLFTEYNNSPTVINVPRWQMDDYEKESTASFALRVAPEAQNEIQKHLDRFKYQDSGPTQGKHVVSHGVAKVCLRGCPLA